MLNFTGKEQFRRKLRNQSHFMMKGDFLIRRRFISCEETIDDFGPRCCTADVRKLFVTKSFNDVVEVRCSLEWEVFDDDCAGLEKE
jgi:hypothetical protein